MAPAYAVPRMLAAPGLDAPGLRPLRDPRGLRRPGALHAGGLGGPGVLPRAARPRRAARLDRPREAQRQRRLARRRPPVRRDRRADRRRPRQAAARARRRARGDLDLRRRRPGRRRDPRGLEANGGPLLAARQQPGRRVRRQEPRAAAAGRARPLRARRAAGRRPRPRRRGAGRPLWRRRRRRPRRCRDAVDSRLDDEVRDGARWSVGRRRGLERRGTRRQRWKALVFDATGIADSTELRELLALLPPDDPPARAAAAGWSCSARRRPAAGDPSAATAQRALEGFIRSAGKEIRCGGDRAARLRRRRAPRTSSTRRLRFLLSPRSAYVSGQVVRVGAGRDVPDDRLGAAAARQGRAGHRRLARHRRGDRRACWRATARTSSASTCPPCRPTSTAVVGAIGGSLIAADITAADAPATIGDALAEQHGGVDVVVHNAGVTRDKTLGGMDEERWSAADRDQPLRRGADQRRAARARALLREDGRIVCVSSMSGIAGNAGQTNYATSKAGVIGMVEAMAPVLAERGGDDQRRRARASSRRR